MKESSIIYLEKETGTYDKKNLAKWRIKQLLYYWFIIINSVFYPMQTELSFLQIPSPGD